MHASLYQSTLETPFGAMRIGVDTDGILVEVSLPNRGPFRSARVVMPASASNGMEAARAQLLEYFDGKRRAFDLQVDARGTEF